ncbi:SUN domain-containing protein 4 [Lolium perenne]|uniref:SUN domain-containing protein 4 n=1 Tax=Lolium perenne TaxID=4522 RepID=UPI0021F5569F|nr:SUN domain-containing protein 4 [Lolium perenne]
MQKSRRALVKRKAAAAQERVGAAADAGRKRRLYGFSASLVVASWVALLLLNSFIGHGDGQRDGGDPVVARPVADPSINEGYVSSGSVHQNHEESLTVADDTCVKLDESVALSEETLLPEDELCSSDGAQSDDNEAVTNDNRIEPSEDQGEQEAPAKDGQIEPSESQVEEEAPTKDDEIEQSKVQDDTPLMKNIGSGAHPAEKVDAEDVPKPARLARVVPPGLDEFKTRAIAERGQDASSQTGHVIHRREPSGQLYNYASAAKGAKVLDFNKEAKGASNILDKDKDKYLRNPCSAEGKFVVLELSEETLVDTVALANFEHYSSNLKEFEMLSSLVYPTENWETLGRFTVANAKQAQSFTFSEPKWARYLKLNLLNHYGSASYCTLSMLEVYGMDAVEKMLENLIPVENRNVESDEKSKDPVEQTPVKEPNGGKDSSQEPLDEDEFELEDDRTNGDSSKNGAHDQVIETRTLQAGRIPGDTVLKVLMQKVQSLDVSFSVLERYLEEVNSRYGQIFKDFDADIDSKDALLQKIKLELKELQNSKNHLAKEIDGVLSWKLVASSQLDQLVLDNAILRSEFDRFRDKQVDMENRSLAVIFLSFVFGCLALAKLSIGKIFDICRLYDFEKFHSRVKSGWLVLLLSSFIIASILVIQ